MSTVTDLESYQQFALQQQAEERAWSAEQADKQMAFQERMSSTAHQREVADLQAAGLNPVLSVNSGASVPNGSMATTEDSASRNVGNILQQVLSAQSAQSVASMYTAATIYAAQLAAEASRYGTDMSYKSKEDHPSTLEEVAARELWRTTQDISSGTKQKSTGIAGKLTDFIQTVKDSGKQHLDPSSNGVRKQFSDYLWNTFKFSSGQLNKYQWVEIFAIWNGAGTNFSKRRQIEKKLLDWFGYTQTPKGKF